MKLRLAVVALVTLVTLSACSSSTTAGLASPSPSRASAVASPSATAAPSPSPSASSNDLPVSAVGFSCRLPVMVEATGTSPVSFQGGFITFPSGSFVADPRGLVHGLAGGVGLQTAEAPLLTGRLETGLPFYDAAHDRWLPVGAAQASPEGASYAYATIGDSIASGGTVHVVQVATGVERTFKVAIPAVGAAAGLAVEDFDGLGVYFVVEQFEGYPAGVWRLELATSHVAALKEVGNVFAVRGPTAWIGYVDPHDPNPPTVPASVRLFDSLVEVNLITGARTTWFYRPGFAVTLMNIDASGRPVVRVDDGPDFLSPATVEIRRLTAPLSGGEDNGDLVYTGSMQFDYVQPDGDLLWLGNGRGVYLYTVEAGLQKLYSLVNAAQEPADQVILPAGYCR